MCSIESYIAQAIEVRSFFSYLFVRSLFLFLCWCVCVCVCMYLRIYVLSDCQWLTWIGKMKWQQICNDGTVPARAQHTCVSIATKLVVFGGRGTNGLLNDLWCFGTSMIVLFYSTSNLWVTCYYSLYMYMLILFGLYVPYTFRDVEVVGNRSSISCTITTSGTYSGSCWWKNGCVRWNWWFCTARYSICD